jgi:hypothetical protein
MKQVIRFALGLVGIMLASCSKETASSKTSTLPTQDASTQLALLQNSWLSSEAVMIPFYGGDSTYGWFGNQVYPVSINFKQNGVSVNYNSIDLTDDQWYDSCAYRLLSDGTTILFYPFSGGVLLTKADTAKIGLLNDSTLVLHYLGTKTACVPDAFHR